MATPPRCNLDRAELEALYAPGVSAETVQVYVYLRWHRNASTGETFVGRPRIAEAIETNERAVSYRLRNLERLGLIVTTRTAGKANTYTFPFATPANDLQHTPAMDCSTPLQVSDTDPCKSATRTPASRTDSNKGLLTARDNSARRAVPGGPRTVSCPTCGGTGLGFDAARGEDTDSLCTECLGAKQVPHE